MYSRIIQDELSKKFKKPYVHILFGARQTGKSTIVKSLLDKDSLVIDLSNPTESTRYLTRPQSLVEECNAIPKRKEPYSVFIDEVQTVPSLFDAVQHLYDKDKNRFRFILCGSSARKLRTSSANLLPGRCLLYHLYPLVMEEHPSKNEFPLSSTFPLKMVFPSISNLCRFPAWDLAARLTYGSLPGIVTAEEELRSQLLKSYYAVYVEEEVRREVMLRDLSNFARFVRFSAIESGNILNYSSISQETGVSVMTIKSYYQILEDMFIGFSVPAFTGSPRKNLLSTSKFFYFDIGVRNAAAGLKIIPEEILASPGSIFEQWVGIELWKRLKYLGEGSLSHFRTKDGAEIDFIIEHGGKLVPVEVKWTENPSARDARHIVRFIGEQKDSSEGYVVCRCPRPMKLTDNVTAIPWHCL